MSYKTVSRVLMLSWLIGLAVGIVIGLVKKTKPESKMCDCGRESIVGNFPMCVSCELDVDDAHFDALEEDERREFDNIVFQFVSNN